MIIFTLTDLHDASPSVYPRVLKNFLLFSCFFWQIVYFIFLIVFCYVILVRLPVSPPLQEIILIVFVFTLFTEEVRQVSVNNEALEVWPMNFFRYNQQLTNIRVLRLFETS